MYCQRTKRIKGLILPIIPFLPTALLSDISFNGKFRDELLNREIFYSLKVAQILMEQWRRYYNEVRPNSSLGYRPPAPQVIVSGNKTKESKDGFLSTH
jgi:Integrase core domain